MGKAEGQKKVFFDTIHRNEKAKIFSESDPKKTERVSITQYSILANNHLTFFFIFK